MFLRVSALPPPPPSVVTHHVRSLDFRFDPLYAAWVELAQEYFEVKYVSGIATLRGCTAPPASLDSQSFAGHERVVK